MLKKLILITFFLTSLTNAQAGNDIPQEVIDSINAFNGAGLVNTGAARNDISQISKDPFYARKQKDPFKKAKFNLDLKIISCQKNSVPEFVQLKPVKHDACGELDAKIILEKNIDVFLTKEAKFANVKPTKIIRTIPEIQRKDSQYIIKDKQLVNTVNLGAEVSVVPTRIVDKKVQMDIAVKTSELADVDEIFLDSNNKSFINNEIALQHRYLVASFPVKINHAETLGGNSAILMPLTSDFKEGANYPESARLWLDVKLGLPKKSID